MRWRTRWELPFRRRLSCRTMIIHPDTTDQSMRNLMYPLNWEEIIFLRRLPRIPEALLPAAAGNMFTKCTLRKNSFKITTTPAISA